MSETTLLLSALPTIYFAFCAWLLSRGPVHERLTWIIVGTIFLFVTSLGGLAARIGFGGAETSYNTWFALQPLNLIVLSLILFMAAVLISFSRNYMSGDPAFRRFFIWMLLTLAAVSFTVVSNHLVLLWLGWVSISLSLHHLLMLYPDRPRAVLAAHKKFILARMAELSLLAAFVLLYAEFGTLYIDRLLDALLEIHTNEALELPWEASVAASFMVVAALIKCAQLPVHGWLIQVVECPTPVSALLHAGVINMGGFVLILFAPLLSQSTTAKWMLLIFAGVSTVLAALIMTTRISAKVRLAWSTSAQMGMMLIECALGLYEVALLHLVLHSLYKAYSFLSIGNAVFENSARRLDPVYGWSKGVVVAALAWVSVLLSIMVLGSEYQGPLSVWFLLGVAFVMLIVIENPTLKLFLLLRSLMLVTALAVFYTTLKHLFADVLALPATLATEAFSVADIWVGLLVLTLFTVSTALARWAGNPRVQHISALLFAGLYLDEWFTRTTLALWPAKLPWSQSGTVDRLQFFSQENV